MWVPAGPLLCSGISGGRRRCAQRRHAASGDNAIPTYEVELNGRNFLLDFDGIPKRVGFYVLWYVDAASPQEAARAAVQAIRGHESLATVLNDRSDPPMVHAEDVIELSEGPQPDEIELGLSFYSEEGEP